VQGANWYLRVLYFVNFHATSGAQVLYFNKFQIRLFVFRDVWKFTKYPEWESTSRFCQVPGTTPRSEMSKYKWVFVDLDGSKVVHLHPTPARPPKTWPHPENQIDSPRFSLFLRINTDLGAFGAHPGPRIQSLESEVCLWSLKDDIQGPLIRPSTAELGPRKPARGKLTFNKSAILVHFWVSFLYTYCFECVELAQATILALSGPIQSPEFRVWSLEIFYSL